MDGDGLVCSFDVLGSRIAVSGVVGGMIGDNGVERLGIDGGRFGI